MKRLLVMEHGDMDGGAKFGQKEKKKVWNQCRLILAVLANYPASLLRDKPSRKNMFEKRLFFPALFHSPSVIGSLVYTLCILSQPNATPDARNP